MGCTIYFHTSKRYSTTQFVPTSCLNVSSFCSLHQPNVGILGMPGILAAIAETPGMDPVAFRKRSNKPEKSTCRPNLPLPPRLGGTDGFCHGLGTEVTPGSWRRGGVTGGHRVTGPKFIWGSASTMEAKAARARITCQIESMILSVSTCSVLCVCWILCTCSVLCVCWILCTCSVLCVCRILCTCSVLCVCWIFFS